MIKIDTKEIRRYEADLKTFARKAYPFATRSTVNGAAFAARREWQANISGKLITRNKFTAASVRVDQSRTMNVRRQAATVGSIAGYMEDQEFGATKVKQGKKGVNLPTSYASGEGMEAKPRKRLPRKANAMQNIHLAKRGRKGRSRKQRNLVAIKQAAAGGNKYVYLDLGRKQGVFKVLGGKRRPYLRMVADLSEQSVSIPATPTLAPAVAATAPALPQLYAEALRFQLMRRGLFRSR